MINSITLSSVLNYISTCVFAFSGTKIGLHSGDSLIVAVLAGVVTAVGGGTIRDTFNSRPPFWIKQPGYIVISVIFAIIAIFYDHGPSPSIPMYGM